MRARQKRRRRPSNLCLSARFSNSRGHPGSGWPRYIMREC
jgi:hypothetical protein